MASSTELRLGEAETTEATIHPAAAACRLAQAYSWLALPPLPNTTRSQ